MERKATAWSILVGRTETWSDPGSFRAVDKCPIDASMYKESISKCLPSRFASMGRFRIVGGLFREFGLFLKEDRTWWLAPILVLLVGLGAFIIFAQGSALAPFIYALF